MLAFLVAVGGDIRGIKIGIVNDENMFNSCQGYNRNLTALPYNYTDCDFDNLSCRFLDDIEDPMMSKVRGIPDHSLN